MNVFLTFWLLKSAWKQDMSFYIEKKVCHRTACAVKIVFERLENEMNLHVYAQENLKTSFHILFERYGYSTLYVRFQIQGI